jgi:hypothetical protein
MTHGARYRNSSSVAALVALMVVAGSAAGQPPDAFEARCAQLSSSRVGVTTVPIAYSEDETLSIDQLNLRSGHTPGLHLTFGLTTAKLASHATVEIHSFENRDGMRACGTLGVDVLLSARPMVVYLAQELDGSPCARTATMEHEMKHVAVFRAALDEAARDLAADLPAVIGTDVQWAKSKAELQRQMNARVTDYLAEFMDQRGRELNERQNGVDSPQEYARVKGACAQ